VIGGGGEFSTISFGNEKKYRRTGSENTHLAKIAKENF